MRSIISSVRARNDGMRMSGDIELRKDIPYHIQFPDRHVQQEQVNRTWPIHESSNLQSVSRS